MSQFGDMLEQSIGGVEIISGRLDEVMDAAQGTMNSLYASLGEMVLDDEATETAPQTTPQLDPLIQMPSRLTNPNPVTDRLVNRSSLGIEEAQTIAYQQAIPARQLSNLLEEREDLGKAA